MSEKWFRTSKFLNDTKYFYAKYLDNVEPMKVIAKEIQQLLTRNIMKLILISLAGVIDSNVLGLGQDSRFDS